MTAKNILERVLAEGGVELQTLLAVALKAVADEVVPEEPPVKRTGMRPGGTGSLTPDEFMEDQRRETRRKILRIVTDLRSRG